MANHWNVVRAGDRDREGLRRRGGALVVGHLVGYRYVAGLALGEVLVSSVRWIEAPCAVGTNRHAGNSGGLGIGRRLTEHVGVGRGQLASENRTVLGGSHVGDLANHWNVVRAGDRDGNLLSAGVAGAVRDGEGILDGDDFAGGEVLGERVGDREVPGDGAAADVITSANTGASDVEGRRVRKRSE